MDKQKSIALAMKDYIGCRVITRNGDTGILSKISIIPPREYLPWVSIGESFASQPWEPGDTLILKDISEISPEDVFYVGNTLSPESVDIDDLAQWNQERKEELKQLLFNIDCEASPNTIPPIRVRLAYQYLCSKFYDIPSMHLDNMSLIEYGIATKETSVNTQ